LILVTDFNWYKQTKPDNIGLSCELKFVDCGKAYYQCKTCTDANGGVYTVFVCFSCVVGGKLLFEGDSSPRGEKIPVTKRLHLSNGEVVDGRTITTAGGSFHANSSTLLSKFQKQEMMKDRKAEKVEQSNPSRQRMLDNYNHRGTTEETEYDGGILQIISSESSANTDLLTRMHLTGTGGSAARKTMNWRKRLFHLNITI